MQALVDLDADVEELLRREVRARNLEFDRVLNDAVRASLSASTCKPERAVTLPTFSMGPPLVDLTKARALAEEWEDEEVIRKMRAAELG